MVTLAYFLTFILLAVLTLSFDMIIYHLAIKQTLNHLFGTDVATGRYYVLIAVSIGLIQAIISDLRIYKQKKKEL